MAEILVKFFVDGAWLRNQTQPEPDDGPANSWLLTLALALALTLTLTPTLKNRNPDPNPNPCPNPHQVVGIPSSGKYALELCGGWGHADLPGT